MKLSKVTLIVVILFILYLLGKSVVTDKKSINDENTVERQEQKINTIFSPWDGSCYKLVAFVKDNLNNAKSFEHVKTEAWKNDNGYRVEMKYRATNGFNALMLGIITADIDEDGNVLKIISSK